MGDDEFDRTGEVNADEAFPLKAGLQEPMGERVGAPIEASIGERLGAGPDGDRVGRFGRDALDHAHRGERGGCRLRALGERFEPCLRCLVEKRKRADGAPRAARHGPQQGRIGVQKPLRARCFVKIGVEVQFKEEAVLDLDRIQGEFAVEMA